MTAVGDAIDDGLDDAETLQRVSRPPAIGGAPAKTIEETTARLGLARTEVHGKGVEDALASTDTPPLPVDPAERPLLEDHGVTRYEARALLGEGGMGAVRLCRDERIGRDVAMKVIHPGIGSRSDARARFLREARVQGQLEHPAIVPVYDLGVGDDGAAFFTMKRVRGQTFEAIVGRLRDGDADVEETYSPRKLLTAFGSACLAVAFAHARGVLHRDLKPANVMLGDFGEVYVLDWGLAKMVGVADPEQTDAVRMSNAPMSANTPGSTEAGAIMGTPGYMAPEQVSGADVDARTDVYALGAILFELLALEPLHRREGTLEALLLSTVRGVDGRASSRAPARAIPFELDEICARATATAPGDRFATVRELVDAVDRFLDGDRDLERRRVLAAQHASAAEGALTRIHGPNGNAARGEAIGEVNRALALDPTHSGALQTMLRLLIEPPTEVPPEAEADIARAINRQRSASERLGGIAYLSWFVTVPFVIAMGVRSAAPLIACAGLILAASGLARYLSKRAPDDHRSALVIFAISTAALVFASLVFGPFVLVPAVAAMNTMNFAIHVPRGKMRSAVIAGGALAVVLPIVFELAGFWPPSMRFHAGVVELLPRAVGFEPWATQGLLVIATLATVIVPAIFHARVRDDAAAVERRMYLQLWQLRQLVPDGARDATRVAEGTMPDASMTLGCDAVKILGEEHARRWHLRQRFGS